MGEEKEKAEAGILGRRHGRDARERDEERETERGRGSLFSGAKLFLFWGDSLGDGVSF